VDGGAGLSRIGELSGKKATQSAHHIGTAPEAAPDQAHAEIHYEGPDQTGKPTNRS
jgi:hypothetical protein